MQLEFPSQPKPSGSPGGAARSGPAQHDSTSQHLAGAEFAQPTRHQSPQMQAQLHNETRIVLSCADSVSDSFILQDNNDDLLRAWLMKNYLPKKSIVRMEWPTRSSDLNPIKHV
ncbi:hypothetical protein AVEN_213160-1 [Araneus ventricosus]|uniref:Tc1-like transposase DDE domain-containing protein n=1 Tax=Araneus ventricosus TaxID=182803 RepID=A0A4Y2RAE6_ARAVE|nr:hypothetical protein AVEN_213160-1 [Araneus ventricosus]